MGKIQKAINRIFNDRKELGLIKQKDLAEALGCSQPSVSNYLSGDTPITDRQIETICDVLGITLADLEDTDRERSPEPAEIQECFAKIQMLYEMSSFPAFKSLKYSIDSWIAASRLVKFQSASGQKGIAHEHSG